MKKTHILLVGILIALVLAGIFSCVCQRDTEAFLGSVDAFIAEVQK